MEWVIACVKLVVRFAICLCILGVGQPVFGQHTLVLPQNFGFIDAQPFLYSFIDTEANRTLADLNSSDVTFIAVDRTRMHTEISTVWTRLYLHNPHMQTIPVLLMHPSPYINYIDIHLLRGDGELQTYALGSHRPRQQRTLIYRYDIEAVLLAPGETVRIYTRLSSLNPLQINTWIFSPDGFLQFAINDALIWGIFTGLVGALVLYNLIAGFSLRQRVFLLYVLHALVLFAFTLTMQGGLIAQFFSTIMDALSPAWLQYAPKFYGPTEARISRILLLFVTVTAALFSLAFFVLAEHAKWLAWILHWWIVLALGLCVVEILAIFWPGLYGVSFVVLYAASAFLLLWFGIALYASWQRLAGWGYYLAGSGSFILLAWIQNAEWIGIDPGFPEFIKIYGTPLGLMLELSFFSLALGQRIRQLAMSQDSTERLLLEHSKFMSVGQMLSGVVHQLKRPVIHASNRVMKLEALLERSVTEREADLPKVVADLRQTIAFMDQIIVDVYRFYAEDHAPIAFKPAEQIEQVITLLTPMNLGGSVHIQRQLLSHLTVQSYPQAFAHAMLIVVENALVVLRERAISEPKINITMQLHEHVLTVSVADNAGGIRIKPIDKIFDPLKRPSGNFGLGIGLGLAKRLIESKLKGSIQAHNTSIGAKFIISFSVKNPKL